MSWKSLFVEEDSHAANAPHTEAHPEEKPSAPLKSSIPGIPAIPGISISTAAPSSTLPVGLTGTPGIDPQMAISFIEKLRSKYAASPFASLLESFHNTFVNLTDAIPEEGSRFRTAIKLQTGVDST